MKTDNLNPPGAHAIARWRGHVGPRAGSNGVTVTDSATDVDEVTVLQGYGGTVAGGDGTALLSYQSVIAYLTNNAGADLPAGSVVILDTGDDESIETTTSAQSTLKVGVTLEAITDGELGPVVIGGYVPLVLVTASVTRGHYLETSTTAGQATANSARRAGSFGQLLTGGTTPTAILFDSSDTSAAISFPGGSTTFLRADGTFAIPPGVGAANSFYDVVTTKGSDEGVTNSATLQDDNELSWAVLANEAWFFQLLILYTTDATGDIKFDLRHSANTCNWVYRYLGSDATNNLILASSGIKDNSVQDTTDIAAGGGALNITRFILIEGYVFVGNNGTISLRFAQNTQTSGQTATVKAGSRLALRKLA